MAKTVTTDAQGRVIPTTGTVSDTVRAAADNLANRRTAPGDADTSPARNEANNEGAPTSDSTRTGKQPNPVTVDAKGNVISNTGQTAGTQAGQPQNTITR